MYNIYQDSGFQGVRLRHNLKFKGWNSHVRGGSPGNSEPSNPLVGIILVGIISVTSRSVGRTLQRGASIDSERPRLKATWARGRVVLELIYYVLLANPNGSIPTTLVTIQCVNAIFQISHTGCLWASQ